MTWARARQQRLNSWRQLSYIEYITSILKVYVLNNTNDSIEGYQRCSQSKRGFTAIRARETQKDKGKNCGSQRNGAVWSRKGGLRAKDRTLVSRTSAATKLGLFKDSGESGIKRVSSDEETSHKQEGGACRMRKRIEVPEVEDCV